MAESGAALFGKLPCRGDFVARGLPAGLRAPLDRWLTCHLAPRARDTWPEGGLRATLALAGHTLSALILPSADRAGRAFPLACCHLPGLSHAAAEAWCDAALPAAMTATRGALSPDALRDALAALPQAPEAPPAPGLWTAGRDPMAADPPAPALAALLGPLSSG